MRSDGGLRATGTASRHFGKVFILGFIDIARLAAKRVGLFLCVLYAFLAPITRKVLIVIFLYDFIRF